MLRILPEDTEEPDLVGFESATLELQGISDCVYFISCFCFIQGMIHCAPRMLFESLVRNAASAPEWNPTVLEARVGISIHIDMYMI